MHEKKTVITRQIEDTHMWAVKGFAEHQIEQWQKQGVFRYWRCGKPKSNTHAFSIITTPGRLTIVGDIGLLVLEREYDMLQWARNTEKDIDYFAGKVRREIPVREYSSDVAREWCMEFTRELRRQHPSNWREQVEKIRELTECADDEIWFKQNLYGSSLVDGCDFPTLETWTPNFLWCREALLWFMERVPFEPLEEKVK